MRTPWQQFAAWTCLVVVLLQGGAMSRGLVLCVEPDGEVNLETAAAGLDGEACGDCPAPSPLGGDESGSRASDERGTCPCVDFALVSCPDRMRSGGDPIQLLQCAHLISLPASFAWHARSLPCAERLVPMPPRGPVESQLVGSIVIRI